MRSAARTGRCTEKKSKSTGQALGARCPFDEKTYIVFNAPRLEPSKEFYAAAISPILLSPERRQKLEAQTILSSIIVAMLRSKRSTSQA